MLNFKSVNIATLVIFIGLIVVNINYPLSFWWFLGLVLIWLTLTSLGSGLIGWNYHLKAHNSNPHISENHISITFDDGPNPEFTTPILELLNKYQAKATFFCIGKHIETHPDILRKIIEQGHTIGNHTYSHANTFGFFKTKKVKAEFVKTNTIVKDLTGLTMRLYRPAFGVTNPRIKKAVKATNLIAIGWNKRSLDTTNLSTEAIFKRTTKNLKKGDIILLHDCNKKSILVLEQLLLFLQEKNLQSVTVDNLLNIKPYA